MEATCPGPIRNLSPLRRPWVNCLASWDGEHSDFYEVTFPPKKAPLLAWRFCLFYHDERISPRTLVLQCQLWRQIKPERPGKSAALDGSGLLTPRGGTFSH